MNNRRMGNSNAQRRGNNGYNNNNAHRHGAHAHASAAAHGQLGSSNYSNGNMGDEGQHNPGSTQTQSSGSRTWPWSYKTKKQTQTYQQHNMQQVADAEMLKEQVNNTFISIEKAATMAQDPQWDESIVNSVTDGALLTLDMFAVSCGEFVKKADKKAINLAKKAVTDKWEQLRQKDPRTFELTTTYRDFLVAALNGNHNLRYKQYRVSSSELDFEAEHRLKNNPQALHDTYQKLITNSQQFDKEQTAIRNNPEKARKIKQRQDKEVSEYQNSARYQNQNARDQSMSNGYRKPKQSDFYFTQSGQKSQFDRLGRGREENEMNHDLMPIDAYGMIPKHLKYPQNAMILLSKQRPLQTRTKPIPCKVLYPSKQAICDKIVVCPAYPFNHARMQYSIDMLCFDAEKVRKCENKHIHKYTKLGNGYASIAAIQRDEMEVANKQMNGYSKQTNNGMNIDNDFQ